MSNANLISFLLKIGLFRIVRNSPQISTNNPGSSWESICKHTGGVSGSLERFPKLTPNPPSSKPWAIGFSPGILLKIGRFRSLERFPALTQICPWSRVRKSAKIPNKVAVAPDLSRVRFRGGAWWERSGTQAAHKGVKHLPQSPLLVFTCHGGHRRLSFSRLLRWISFGIYSIEAQRRCH